MLTDYNHITAVEHALDDVLRTQGNEIMLWHQHPTDADIATITGCLSS